MRVNRAWHCQLAITFTVDDKTGKSEGINMVIGRRSQGAFGNSTRDQRCSNTQVRVMARD